MSEALAVIVVISLILSAAGLVVGMVMANKAENMPLNSIGDNRNNLSDIRRIEMSEGLVVPLVYGNSQVGGNIIWWNYSQYDSTHYQVSLWLTICMGEIEKVYANSPNYWIMVDNKYLKADLMTYFFRQGLNNLPLPFYVVLPGGDRYNILDSLPDKGMYASPLKNIAHIYIYNYILEENMTYIPLISFKIKRKLQTGITNQDITVDEAIIDLNGILFSIAFVPLAVTIDWVPWIKCCINYDGKYRLLIKVEKLRSTWGFMFTGYVKVSNDFGLTYTSINTGYCTSCCMSDSGRIMLYTLNEDWPQLSTDYGVTWNDLITPLGQTAKYSCSAMSETGKTIVICAFNGKVIVTNDYGNTWSEHLSSKEWYAVAISKDGNTIVPVALNDTQVNITRNNGITWLTKGTLDWPCDVCMDKYGIKIYILNYNSKYVYASNNSGDTWSNISNQIDYLHSISCDSTGIYVVVTQDEEGGNTGLFTTSNFGAVWTERWGNMGKQFKDAAISGNAYYYIFTEFTPTHYYIVDIFCATQRTLFLGHNPVAIIYDLLINQLKKTEDDINMVNFNLVAVQMEIKKYALNIAINQPTAIKEIIDRIQNICDIYLVKNASNKYELLYFRDTDVDKTVITDIDIVDINFTRKSWDDTFNSFTGIYNPSYEIDTQYPEGVNLYVLNQRSLTVKNDANILLTGNVRSKNIDLSWLGYKSAVENRLKEIMLRESYPFSIVNLTLGIKHSFLILGDVIKIDSYDLMINNHYRVIDIDSSEIDKNEIKITCMEIREVLTA